MKFTVRSWFAVLTLAAIMLAGLWLSRGQIDAGARERMARQYHQRVLELPEREAAELVRELASDRPPWLEVVLEAALDERPAVATAAETELRLLLANWTASPDRDSTQHAIRLASLLAKRRSSLPPQGQLLANVLAKGLIALPIDSRQYDVASYIADCEAVLRLEPSPLDEIRVASAVSESVNPQAGPDVQPLEPRQFNAPAVLRITDR